ncbi:MAG: hypothetical protein O7H41_03820 [Planctomycetota bacterium]|nr:hypothetical protein [Planctomycetota bacterium]
MDESAAHPPTPHEQVEQLAKAYLEQLERGEKPDRRSILNAHPDLRELLNRQFDLMEMIHGARPDPEPGGEKGRFTGPPGAPPEAPYSSGADDPDDEPEHIGPYRLIERIASGGMGVVYLAEQTDPILRRVALKLIKAGLDTDEVIARFEWERQALSLMSHPHIVRMFDAGKTENGRPYFAMEHIPGLPINDHADRNRLRIIREPMNRCLGDYFKESPRNERASCLEGEGMNPHLVRRSQGAVSASRSAGG